MKIKIAIADSNETYAARLFDALQKQENLSISVYTNKEKMEKEITSVRYDIILFDHSMYSGDNLFKNSKLAVMLYDEDNELPSGFAGKFAFVKKFQRGSTIYKEVIGIYSEYVSDPFSNSTGHCKVISFYSPVGGSGKTTLSLSVARSVANKGRSVMYLNFEPIASYGAYMPLKGSKGMGELMAALDSSGSFGLKLESLMQKTPQGIIYFEKFENILDIYEITSEDIEKLIRKINETGTADYIIIDMGISFDQLDRSILDISDKIVLAETPDKTAKEKIKKFSEHRTVMREYSDKICSVINFSNGASDMSAAGYEIAGRIPEKKCDPDELVSYISKYSLLDMDMLIS